MTTRLSIHLGYEVGTGAQVEIPLAHTFVTGQTQLSGKTTTLRAIVERSGRRSLAFITKRGEAFEGRRIRPYLPREGAQPIHWRLVETILASALGQRSMKYERLWLINAVKRPAIATTLAMVRGNVAALLAKAKNNSADVYTLIGEYLDLVLPDMRALDASDVLELREGLNVMDLANVSQQLQALVIRASLEHINRHETNVLTVFPEAWEFAPRGTAAPAKDEAIAMARKGAVLGNFLLCDSQDIAGVDTVVRQAASVWILGVQRELNELKRTIQTIPAGIRRPKPEDVATLELGQFYACWGRHAIKTYVQPAWMPNELAAKVARDVLDVRNAGAIAMAANVTTAFRRAFQEETVTSEEAAQLTRENEELKTETEQLKNDNAELRRRLDALERKQGTVIPREAPDEPLSSRRRGSAGNFEEMNAEVTTQRSGTSGGSLASTRTWSAEETLDNEVLYQAFKARLIEELPSDARMMQVVLARPELKVIVQKRILDVDGETLRGQIARLIADGFFDTEQTSSSTIAELVRRGAGAGVKFNVGNELVAIAAMGFLTRETQKSYKAAPGMKVNIVESVEA